MLSREREREKERKRERMLFDSVMHEEDFLLNSSFKLAYLHPNESLSIIIQTEYRCADVHLRMYTHLRAFACNTHKDHLSFLFWF